MRIKIRDSVVGGCGNDRNSNRSEPQGATDGNLTGFVDRRAVDPRAVVRVECPSR